MYCIKNNCLNTYYKHGVCFSHYEQEFKKYNNLPTNTSISLIEKEIDKTLEVAKNKRRIIDTFYLDFPLQKYGMERSLSDIYCKLDLLTAFLFRFSPGRKQQFSK